MFKKLLPAKLALEATNGNVKAATTANLAGNSFLNIIFLS